MQFVPAYILANTDLFDTALLPLATTARDTLWVPSYAITQEYIYLPSYDIVINAFLRVMETPGDVKGFIQEIFYLRWKRRYAH